MTHPRSVNVSVALLHLSHWRPVANGWHAHSPVSCRQSLRVEPYGWQPHAKMNRNDSTAVAHAITYVCSPYCCAWISERSPSTRSRNGNSLSRLQQVDSSRHSSLDHMMIATSLLSGNCSILIGIEPCPRGDVSRISHTWASSSIRAGRDGDIIVTAAVGRVQTS